MTSAQIDGLSRAALALISGLAIMYGYGDEKTWAIISGSMAALITAAWSIYSNTSTQLVTQAAKAEEVKVIVTDDQMANAIPDSKVIPGDAVRFVQ
jgi:plastocyanin